LRYIPDITAGAGLRGKPGAPGFVPGREYSTVKLIKDLVAFLCSLLDVLAYRLTFC